VHQAHRGGRAPPHARPPNLHHRHSMIRRSWWPAARRPASPWAPSVSKSTGRVFNQMGARLSVTSPLSYGRRGVRPDSWDHGLRTSSRAHIGPAPPRAHEDSMLRNGLHRPGPPRRSCAAMCGSQTLLGLSIWIGLGGPDLPSPPEGVRYRHVPSRW
jgi:hypothetical protein